MGLSDRDYYREESEGFSFVGGNRSVVTTLLIINIGIFLLDWLSSSGGDGFDLSRWFAVSGETLSRPWLWYQFLTYGFFHDTQNIWHILSNMFVLWMFGRQIENRYGSREFLSFYLIALLFGGIVFSLTNLPFAGSSSAIGASGAVVGVLILFIFNYPKVNLLLMGVIPIPAWVVGIFIIVGDLIGSFNDRSQIAHSVHLAGIVFAIAYFYFKWNLSRLLPGDLSSLKKWFQSKPKLKVYQEEEHDPYHSQDQNADKLLEKVNREGIESLTDKERKQLEAYSRRMSQKHR